MASPITSAGPAGPCPVPVSAEHADFIREVLDRVGDKWALLVIATLQNRAWRYSELRNAVPGISQRMLAVTLRQLVQDGLATRTSYPEVPPRVEYALTPPRGEPPRSGVLPGRLGRRPPRGDRRAPRPLRPYGARGTVTCPPGTAQRHEVDEVSPLGVPAY